MRTEHADLLTAQQLGYPTGGVSPAIKLVLADKTGGTTYDYSFDPTSNTNRLTSLEHIEALDSDSGTFILRNNDLTIPDLREFYVDPYYGANTSSGLRWTTATGCPPAPRLWVAGQAELSGGTKGTKPDLYSILSLEGVWTHFLNTTPARIGVAPFFRDENSVLRDKTAYSVLEYLIETALTAATGYTFTLDPLGDQDDGIINNSSRIPWPTERDSDNNLIPDINLQSPGTFETYGDLIKAMLNRCKCQLRTEGGLAFKVVYPQESDTVNESYYSSLTDGHAFYENKNTTQTPKGNHWIVYCNKGTNWENVIYGNAYWSGDYDLSFIPPQLKSGKTERIQTAIWPDISSQVWADELAAACLQKDRTQAFGGRFVTAHDNRPELYDYAKIYDKRGT